MPGLTLKSLLCVIAAWLCVASLASHATAQPSRNNLLRERVAVAVSSDGSQLAIARGSQRVMARNGRVELWDLKTGRLRHTITGFDGSILQLSFAPDGKNLVTASLEYRQSKVRVQAGNRSGELVTEVKWWDVITGEFIRRLTIEGLMRMEIMLSPDGTIIAAIRRNINSLGGYFLDYGPTMRPISESFEIKLYDSKTGAKNVKMTGSATSLVKPWELWFTRFVFSQDGKLFAAVAASEVKIWDVATGKKIQTIKNIEGRPFATAFSPDSQYIAISTNVTSRRDGMTLNASRTNVWEISTARLIRSLYDQNDLVATVRFANDGKALLLGTQQYQAEGSLGTVKIWDFTSNREASFNVHEGESVSWLQFFPAKGELVLQSGESVEVRDVKTWRVKQSFEPNPEDRVSKATNRFLLSLKQVIATTFSSDGITVSGVIPEDGFRRWDSRTGAVKPIQQIKPSDGLIARSANGMVLGELTDKEIKLWDLSTGSNRTIARPGANQVSAFGMSYDGRLLAIAEDSRIIVRSSDDESSTRSLMGHQSSVQHLMFSSDGSMLVSADESGTIKTWDIGNSRLKQSISTGGDVTALAIDPTGQFVATAGPDYLVSLWNTSTGALQVKLKKHGNVVNALAFSPDGKTLASGGDDRVAVLWDIIAGKSKQTLKGHDVTVTSLAFSPDGQLLAAGSGNASVVLWNVDDGRLDRVLH